MHAFLSKNMFSLFLSLIGVLALGVGIMLVWQTYDAQAALEKARQNAQLGQELSGTVALQARERGMTAVALGGENGGNFDDLRILRQQVDLRWQQAGERMAQLASDSAQNAHVKSYLSRIATARAAVQIARGQVDQSLASGRQHISIDTWLQTTGTLIATTNQLIVRLPLSMRTPQQSPPEELLLRDLVNEIGEMAGQIRGWLSFYASSRQPLAASHRAQIEATHNQLLRNFGNLQQLLHEHTYSTPLQNAVDTLEQVFSRQFQQSLQQMLAHGDTGEYPLSGHDWYAKATTQIDTLIRVSETLSQLSVERLRQQLLHKSLQLIAFVVLSLVAAGAALVAILQLRKRGAEFFYQRELAQITLHSIGDAVITTDALGNVEYLNPVAETLTGWSVLEARGIPVVEVFRVENTLRSSLVNPVAICLREGRVVGLTSGHKLLQRNGEKIGIEDSCAPIRTTDGKVVGCVIVFYAIDSAHNADYLLSYHATRDSLTGLVNRREFERQLQELLLRSRNFGEHHVLAYIDLDQFKVVNDTCGHTAGDRMLGQITFLLRKRVRDSDTLARLGGDEFALLLRSCPLERAVTIIDELRNELRSFRFFWEDKAFEISMSIGVVPILPSSSSATELLIEADAACYAAKDKGRNRYQIYHHDDMELAQRKGQMQWVTRITDALERDRLTLYCQRLKPLRSGCPERVEILLRMLDSNNEIIAPMAFIPAAERYNLMADVDRWVIRNLCTHLRTAHDQAGDTVFNINLSGLSLSDRNLATFIMEVVEKSGFAPNRFCFEITETAAVNSLDTVLQLAETLQVHGVTFSLDDFGSGLSSFNYLKTLPVQQIKIDGTFVRNMLQDPLDQALVRSVVDIARVLGIQVCAEFVEDEATLDHLRQIGVDYAQGYAIGYPMPLQRFLAKPPIHC